MLCRYLYFKIQTIVPYSMQKKGEARILPGNLNFLSTQRGERGESRSVGNNNDCSKSGRIGLQHCRRGGVGSNVPIILFCAPKIGRWPGPACCAVQYSVSFTQSAAAPVAFLIPPLHPQREKNNTKRKQIERKYTFT